MAKNWQAWQKAGALARHLSAVKKAKIKENHFKNPAVKKLKEALAKHIGSDYNPRYDIATQEIKKLFGLSTKLKKAGPIKKKKKMTVSIKIEKPPGGKIVKAPSSSSSIMHEVGIDKSGKAVSCGCIAFRIMKKTTCRHILGVNNQ